MSPRTARRVLFLAALLVAPLPMLGVDAFVPVVRHLLLGAVCIGMRIAEGPGGVVWQLAGLFLGHALVYTLVIWGAAWLAGRALAGLPRAFRGALVAGLVLGSAFWALLTEPYVTPFGRAPRGNLLEVLR